MPKEVYATLFGSKENTNGAILYGMKDQKPLVALIVEFTAVNPDTNIEEDGYIIFPKVSFGEMQEDAASKDADGRIVAAQVGNDLMKIGEKIWKAK